MVHPCFILTRIFNSSLRTSALINSISKFSYSWFILYNRHIYRLAVFTEQFSLSAISLHVFTLVSAISSVFMIFSWPRGIVILSPLVYGILRLLSNRHPVNKMHPLSLNSPYNFLEQFATLIFLFYLYVDIIHHP